MQHRTHESPPRARISRKMALELELLVDLREWSEEAGISYPFSHPAAITLPCWEQITKVPYRLLGKTTADERVAHVARRAAMALEQFLKKEENRSRERPFRLEFGASLPTSSAEGGSWKILQIESSLGDSRETVLTIDLRSPSRFS